MVRKIELRPAEISRDGDNSVAREAIRSLLNPEPDKLSGLTRLPLDQVRPCSFARTFIDAMLEHCRLARESQKFYSENRKIWHSENWEMQGIGKRFPPDPELNDDSFKGDSRHEKFMDWIKQQDEKHKDKDNPPRFFPIGYQPEIIDVKKDPDFKIPKVSDSLVYKYLQQFYLHRRSITPMFADGVIDLAKMELETRMPESEYNPYRPQ